MKTEDEIKQHLRTGDYAKIGKTLGISANYANKLMKRKTAARHNEVVEKAREVATFNKNLGL